MLKKYHYTVFIGRFEPLHLGHLYVINQALDVSERLIILCGSLNLPKSQKNPWTFQERKQMIESSLPQEMAKKVQVEPLKDYNSDTKWSQHVKDIVFGVTQGISPESKIALIGHNKDSSSYYLQMFPMWGLVEVENYQNISSTSIRDDIFLNRVMPDSLMPKEVTKIVKEWLKSYSWDLQ